MYKLSTTLAKGITPAVIIPIVAEGISMITGGSVSKELCYQVGTGAYAVYVGIRNWLKNRNKRESSAPQAK